MNDAETGFRTDEAGAVAEGNGHPRQPLAVQSLDALWTPSPAAPPAPATSQARSRPKHGQGRAKKAKNTASTPKSPLKAVARKALRSGVGVVLDGNIAHRAVVKDGIVVSYQAFEGESQMDALRAALDGTKGAKVVVLGGLLFKAEAELPASRRRQSALAMVAAGTAAWPAANLAAVAVWRPEGEAADKAGKVSLAGLEGPVPEGFWEALAKVGATASPLPFVLASRHQGPDQSWFVVGKATSWIVTVAGGRPTAYRELKTGASALPQAAAMAGVELSRLGKAGVGGQARQGGTTEVFVAGVPTGQRTTEALSRAGLHVGDPPLDGVERWEIPVVEQGLALLAVRAALASTPPLSSYASPEALARAAEAPARRRRALVTALVAAVVLAILASGVLPMLNARQKLSTAKSALSAAAEDKAAVAKWLELRAEAQAADSAVREARAENPAYATALSLLESTAPPGASLTSVVATPPVSSGPGSSSSSSIGTGVEMTVEASVKSATFAPVAAWQRRLESSGASVEVTSESVLKGDVDLTMTVAVP